MAFIQEDINKIKQTNATDSSTNLCSEFGCPASTAPSASWSLRCEEARGGGEVHGGTPSTVNNIDSSVISRLGRDDITSGFCSSLLLSDVFIDHVRRSTPHRHFPQLPVRPVCAGPVSELPLRLPRPHCLYSLLFWHMQSTTSHRNVVYCSILYKYQVLGSSVL